MQSATQPLPPSRSQTPAPDEHNQPWITLLGHLRSQTWDTKSVVPFIPVGTPVTLFNLIHQAHNAGFVSARGKHTEFPTPGPPVTTSRAAETLWIYYNAGVDLGITSLNSATTSSRTATTKAAKVADLKPFSGNRVDYDDYHTDVLQLFNSDPSRYATDAAKINTASSYLTGSAKAWARPHMNKETGTYAWKTFPEFIKALKAAFDDPDARSTAERKLLSLTQGNRDCSQYHAEFTTHLALLDWSAETKISRFRAGLTRAVAEMLIPIMKLPSDFDEFAQLCIQIDNRIRLLKATTSYAHPAGTSRPQAVHPTPAPASAPVSAPSTSTATGTNPGPMDLSATGTRRRGPLSPETRQYRRDNGLCVYCGEKGHWASNCPRKTTRRINVVEATPTTNASTPGAATAAIQANLVPPAAVISAASVPAAVPAAVPAQVLYEAKN